MIDYETRAVALVIGRPAHLYPGSVAYSSGGCWRIYQIAEQDWQDFLLWVVQSLAEEESCTEQEVAQLRSQALQQCYPYAYIQMGGT